MEALDRIKKAHVAIMRHPKWCAFSGVTAAGKVTVTDEIPTACTDGLNVRYSPTFVATLSEPELRFVILHENAGHKAYKHMRMWRHLWKDNPRLANIAADHFVNLSLVDTDAGEGFITMPKVGVQPDPQFRGWSVQQIFEYLKQEQDPDNPDGPGGQDGEDGGFDQHDWKSAGEMSDQQAEEQAREIDQALRQGEMVARKMGKGKGASSMLVQDLLTPKVDWRAVLREFITQTCAGRDESTWRRPNRRYLADDVYMPSMESTTMGELVVGIDTSGSCFTGSVISRFASELAAIIEQVKPSKVRVLYWDCGICAEQIFEDGQFALGALKPSGGGGTDGSSVSTYLRAKNIVPEAIVQFTDGYVGSWGEQVAPTLWAITEKHITAPFGVSLHLDI
jgi:predicted metal-dependent peptidase